MIIIAEQLVGDATHVQQVFRIRSDTAKNAEDGLHKKRRFRQTSIDEMCQGIQVTDVVAFVFKTGATSFAQPFQDYFDIRECVPKDSIARATKIIGLPVVLPIAEFIQRRIQPEVHGPHVQGTHFRLQCQRAGDSFLDRHRGRAAGCDIDHGIASVPDAR